MKLASKRSHRLSRMKLRGQLGIALALTTVALGADAAGLGRLNLMSGLGQPLRAEIELNSLTRDEAGSLTAKLAGADAFTQANLEYGAALSGLRFSIQRRANGQPYVLVTSNQIVNEPYLDMLVELTWSSGRLVREYTMLLDPPETRAARREVEPGTIVQAQTATPGVSTTSTSRAASTSSSTASSTASSSVAVAPRTRRAPRGTPLGAPESSGTAGTQYRVQPGDTAISIARNNKPDNVALEQMLAALYSGNPRAFAGNINRLLAGATLRIPDASGAQAIDKADAHRIIVAQSSNFGRYRDRVARDATEVPSSRSAGRLTTGQLTTRVEDKSAPAVVKDRLELSRADANKAGSDGGKAGAPGTSAVRGTLNAPATDEIAAKERELQETKGRLALLEKNVADLQKLLQLKNQTLADLQKGNDTKLADASTPAAASAAMPTASTPAPLATSPGTTSAQSTTPAPVTTPPVPTDTTPKMPASPSSAAPASASPAASSTTASTAPTTAATTKTTAKSATDVTPESNWFGQLMENTMLLIGVAILLVLLMGYGLYTMQRRRKLARFEDSIFVDNSILRSNSLFGTTGGQSVDTANTGFHSNFVPVAGNLPEQNEVDPVAEADVYIAYGRDAQAEEILKEALRSDPSRHAVRLKLLEIYAKRGDAKTFETVASELYAATGGQGDEWKQAAALGASVDSQNPLYRDVSPATAASIRTPTNSPTTAPLSNAFSSLGPAAAFAPEATPVRSASALGAGLAGAAVGAAGFAASNLNLRGAGSSSSSASAHSSAFDELTRTDPLPRVEPPVAPGNAPAMDLDFNLGLSDIGIAPLGADATTASPSPTRGSGLDFDVGESTNSIIEPFTASAFGVSDPTARTAVNLPAFRARAEREPRPARHADPEGFTASDIFGSSISAISGDTEPMGDFAPERTEPAPGQPQPAQHVLDSHQFDKTEPYDAMSHINLELDQPRHEASEFKPNDASSDAWQAMATKLDLAMAYRDIGDTDGARELLEEVVRSGDQAQAERARQLIGELG